MKRPKDSLGIGFTGSGFNASFQMLRMKGVRDCDVLGVWSPHRKNAAIAAAYRREIDVGQARAYSPIGDQIADFIREVKASAGEDLVEKQNAEMGLMPVVANEAMAYGYEAEDRHFVRAFLGKEKAKLTFDDGLEVVKMLMTAYQSAEQGKTLDYPGRGVDKFIPAVAKGTWKP